MSASTQEEETAEMGESGPEGPVVTIRIMSQVDDGDEQQLSAYELHSLDETPACVAHILREVADEFEAADPGELLTEADEAEGEA